MGVSEYTALVSVVAMGPRLCSRGEVVNDGFACPAHIPSQWGHGFVAVERARQLARRRLIEKSQWGYGFVAVERRSASRSGGRSPQSQWGHGFVAVERASWRRRPARFVLSQWGHGFVAVERMRPSNKPVKTLRRNGATAL